VFFAWVAKEFGIPNPYDDKALNRYAPGDTESPVSARRLPGGQAAREQTYPSIGSR